MKDIVFQNKNSLKSIDLIVTSPDTIFFETFELLSNIIDLKVEISKDTSVPRALKVKIFSNLTRVEFKEYFHELLPFFSVSHPVLTHISLYGNITILNIPKFSKLHTAYIDSDYVQLMLIV
jgi:hypothetical protein